MCIYSCEIEFGEQEQLITEPNHECLGINTGGGFNMKNTSVTLTVRSVAPQTKLRLEQLKAYTRLTYGSLLDDAVQALWDAYEVEGHVVVEEDALAA